MPKKATAQDANLILKLYDLRREAEMRKARNWFILEFTANSAEDVINVMKAFGSDGNRYFRMVTSYWEMAAAMVNHGAINQSLFEDCNGEPFLTYAKVAPFIADLRKAFESPEMLVNLEKMTKATDKGRKRLKLMAKRLEQFRQMKAAAGKS